MYYRKLFVLITVLSLALSACSVIKAEPTMSLEDIQATAQSVALTSVAQTEMAKPTEPPTQTPIPPTPIVEVTEEPVTEVVQIPQEVAPVVPPPTEPAPVVIVQPSDASSAGDGQCDPYLTAGDKGARTSVTIKNQSAGPMTLSIYLYPTKLNACGSTSVTLESKSETTMELIEGCYYLHAWINGKKPSNASAEYCFKVADGPRKWIVSAEVIEQR